MADTIKPPETKAEANKLLGRLRTVENDLASGAAVFDNEIQAVITKHVQKAKPLLEKRQAIVDALEVFGREHRDEIVIGDTKTARFAQGTISWRMGTKLVVEKGMTQAVVEQLRKRKLLRKFTTQPARSLNKRELVKHPKLVERLRGVRIAQGEHMQIKPKDSKLESIEEKSPYHIPPEED